jgi:hypothetical protein
MTVRDGDKKLKLEWWDYRSCGDYSPLWDTTTKPPPTVPTGDEAVYGNPVAPGLIAWRKKNWNRFNKILTSKAMDRYMLDIEREVFGCLYPKERNRAMHAVTKDVWPERRSEWPKEILKPGFYPIARISAEEYTGLLSYEEVERRPQTEAELISRFGLDSKMLVALGGWRKLLTVLPPEDLKHYTELVVPIGVPRGLRYEDGAIQSWYTTAFTQQPLIPSFKALSVRRSKPVHLVLAGNGSGKTTFARECGGSGAVVDTDEILRKVGYLDQVRLVSKKRTRPPEIAITTAAAALSSYEPDVVLTQMPPHLIKPVLDRAGCVVTHVTAVVVPMYEAWLRVASSRMWDFGKQERRTERFSNSIADWEGFLGIVIPKVRSFHSIMG